jgi:hypothetical protein
MAARVSAEYVRQILDYNPDKGVLVWRCRPDRDKKWNSRCAGKEAGEFSPSKYRRLTIDGKTFSYHHIVWLHQTGEWPIRELDHIDRDKMNNRIENLRLATRSEQMRNTVVRKDNKTGLKGVCWDKKSQRWFVSINVEKETKYRGYFNCPELAHLVYSELAGKYHGKFARTE